ncbi:MAG TPA: MoxR family ATPase [Myxococcota bacterium]|nr:MoxR family ATPase [Myxococcota bacterium]HRY93021.1 MoxR family ATPase [Myxococcota bacterium]HSA20246.1 MoxR family ATPase [Myxococcota bacterium]
MAEEKRSFLDWLVFKGPAETAGELTTHLSELDGRTLADKLRRLYAWILNNAVLTPAYDLAYGERGGEQLTFPNGDTLALPEGEAYSSYILLPLLSLAARRKCLLVGGPGRGKTAIASLLAQAAGIEREALRRAVQHGHPQLTVTDLLGTPLPADLLRAEELSQIKVAWRRWLELPVKIVDEYNRIPTKTQSALLSLMAEGYAEQFGQVVEAGPSAWFLTANDDAGGGTFAVIEALRDRIDVTVRALTFNPWHLDRLLERLEKGRDPADAMPAEVRFQPAELDQMEAEIRSMAVPRPVLRRIEFFLGALDFCQRASPLFEHKSKDALKLAGLRLGQVCNEDCPLDKARHVCSQVETGVSVRTYLTTLAFAKAMAYFRGRPRVELEDVRQLAPFVLHEKLSPNRQSAYFSKGRERLLGDKAAWIRAMFDLAMDQYEALRPGDASAVEPLLDEVAPGLTGLGRDEILRRLKTLTGVIRQYHRGGELSAPVYNDLLMLKALALRYHAYLRWLAAGGKDGA